MTPYNGSHLYLVSSSKLSGHGQNTVLNDHNAVASRYIENNCHMITFKWEEKAKQKEERKNIRSICQFVWK